MPITTGSRLRLAVMASKTTRVASKTFIFANNFFENNQGSHQKIHFRENNQGCLQSATVNFFKHFREKKTRAASKRFHFANIFGLPTMADRKRLIFANIFVKTTRAVSKRVILQKFSRKLFFLLLKNIAKFEIKQLNFVFICSRYIFAKRDSVQLRKKQP